MKDRVGFVKSIKIYFRLNENPLKNSRAIYNLIMYLNSNHSPKLRIFPLAEENSETPAGIALYGSRDEVKRISGEVFSFLDENKSEYKLEESDFDLKGFVDYDLPVMEDLSSDDMEQSFAQKSFGFRKLPHSLPAKEKHAYNLWRNLQSGIAFYHLKMLPDAKRQLEKVIKADPDNFEACHYLGLVYEMLDNDKKAVKYLQKALKIDPDSGATHFFIGNVYQKLEKFETAINHYKKAIEIDPEVPIIYNNLGWIFLQIENYDQALRAFEHSIALDPDLPFPHNGLGVVLQEKGMLDEAAMEFETAIDIFPDYTAAHLKLGWIYYLMSDYDAAIAEYKRVLQTTDDPQFTLNAHNSMAHAFLAKENHTEAINEFAAVIKIDPNHAEAYYHLGLVALKLELYEDAIQPLEKALELDPAINPELSKNLSFAYTQAGLYDKALTQCNKALSVEPDDPEIYELMGGIFVQKKDWNKAMDYFQKTINLNPNSSQTRFSLAWTYENLNKHQEAVEHYKKAIMLDPESVDAYTHLAWLYVKLNKPDEAEILFEKALELKSNDAVLLSKVGWFYTTIGKYEAALDYYRKALSLDPDNPFIHNHIGILYLKKGETVKAKSKLELALQLDDSMSQSATSYYYLGNIAYQEKDFSSALNYYEKSKDIDPEHGEVYYKIGLTHKELGKKSLANKAFKEYLKRKPEGKYVNNAIEFLKPLKTPLSAEKKKQSSLADKSKQASLADKSKQVSSADKSKQVSSADKSKQVSQADKNKQEGKGIGEKNLPSIETSPQPPAEDDGKS